MALSPSRCYFLSHHQNTKPMDVVVREIVTEIAISFAHSQYDTHAFPVGSIAAPHHPSK